MANLQTSPVAPPSIALAMMAVRLAELRRGEGFIKAMILDTGDGPASRSDVAREPQVYRVSGEYYRIIDRISAGRAP